MPLSKSVKQCSHHAQIICISRACCNVCASSCRSGENKKEENTKIKSSHSWERKLFPYTISTFNNIKNYNQCICQSLLCVMLCSESWPVVTSCVQFCPVVSIRVFSCSVVLFREVPSNFQMMNDCQSLDMKLLEGSVADINSAILLYNLKAKNI